MALTYGFYNSIEGDRVYDAIQFGRIFDGIIKDGVYATYEKGMMVIASANPAEVIIQPGRAWFNHTWSYNDANVIFEAPAPEVLLERYDALVLEINEELSSRENSYKWVTGTPSSRPERPTLTNTSTIHQYPLCYVHRYPETTMIYTRDITNAIGTSECPFATGVLEGIDLDAWINQWDDEFHNWESTTKTGFETWMLNQEQVYTAWFDSMHSQMDTDLAEFEAWFQTIQGIIDEDAALHLQQEIDELRQEATSGSRIFVHTINQSLFGKNVTITEAGGTVFTSRFDNTGVAEFKSIPYVGNLTISSTDGVQTATSVVNTPYYARYNFTIAFWAATVNIIGDPEMSGSTVTVRDSNEILVGTVVLGSAGTGIFTATAPDTYKFTLTYGGETMEVTLSVTQETTYTVDLHAAGFKWRDWLEAGGVTGSYSSLDDVLEDEVALRRLFTVHASVDYMADINDENEDVEKIINKDLAAKWINLSDYALDTLHANEIIAGYMDTADKYFYGEWTLVGQVPTMTSNTAPYGEASASSANSGYEAYKAFDGNTSDRWSATDTGSSRIVYKFTSPICINKVSGLFGVPSGSVDIKYKVQASNTNTPGSYVDLSDEFHHSGQQRVDTELNNTEEYLYYSILCTNSSNNGYMSIGSLQFYAWQPKGNVPAMTSNTAPYGTASARSAGGGAAYNAFSQTTGEYGSDNTTSSQEEYLAYKFVNPVCAKRVFWVTKDNNNASTKYDFSIDGSNNGVNWESLYRDTSFTLPNNVHTPYVFNLNNDGYYLYYRIRRISHTFSGANRLLANTLQFYGRELKVSVPTMTSNTTPYGEVVTSALMADASPGYKLFDNDDTTYASLKINDTDGWVAYKFTSPMLIKKAIGLGYPNLQYKIIYSDDGETWNDGSAYVTADSNGLFEIEPTITSPHLYIGLHRHNSSLSNGIAKSCQFYGLDYSEKEFEEGTTKKWLYDHGVELETMTLFPNGATAIKESDGVYLYDTGTDKWPAFYFGVSVANYNLIRAKLGEKYYDNGTISVSMLLATMAGESGASTTAKYTYNTHSEFPNNIYSDISSDTTSNYVRVAERTDSGKGTGYTKVVELWLE